MVIGEEKDFGEFNELQEYSRQNTIRSLEEGRDKEELKKNIHAFGKFAGLASNDRRRLIKAAIRVVIDNLVPNRLRVLFNLVNKKSTASLQDIKKLFRMDKQRFEVEVKDPKFNELDRLHYYMGMDPEVHYQIQQDVGKFRYFKEGFQKCIHDLIKARNRILNLQLNFKK